MKDFKDKDIVDQLRECDWPDAAEEIVRLRAKIERLEFSNRVLADVAAPYYNGSGGDAV
jgi:hypothetical protein